jgi:hypothetical protein
VSLAVNPVLAHEEQLTARAEHSFGWFSPLIAWHLLSLDAPTVAALWAWSFARAMHLSLPWHAPLLLALGTWLVYVADRLLDGLRPLPADRLRPRHRFHVRHAPGFVVAAIAIGSFLLWLIRFRMSAPARREDTVLFFAALLYLAIVHKAPENKQKWLPKELAVGIVFAAACAVPAWSRLPSGRASMLPAIVLFALLCWLNCVAIERWENPGSTQNDALAATHPTTRWTASHFQPAALILATLAGSLAVLNATHPGPMALSLATLISASLLAIVDRLHARFPTIALRVMADLSLLTPLLCLPILR